MKTSRFLRAMATLAAFMLAVAVAMPVMAYAALRTNYEWYRGHEADASYVIGTAGEMKALAKLVNGAADYDGDGTPDVEAVDFAGKTITVADATNLGKVLNFLNEPVEPIGTQEHPFRGAFDGGGFAADSFTLSIVADEAGALVSDVGLFGYVGEGGSICNFSVGSFASISITCDAASKAYVTNVGMLAGYCAGTITNCGNAGTLTIASSVAQQSEDDSIPVRNVGGVVGQCVYDVAGCWNAGCLSITQDAVPDPDITKSQLVARVGGVVGLLGDDARIGTYDKHIFGEADKHGAVSNCSNTGTIFIDTPMEGPLDRFGQQTNAESLAIGGIVGYSQGSVIDCVNGLATSPELDSSSYRAVGYIRAENGSQVGGICGSLRGVVATNVNAAWADDGADGNDPLVISGCTNYGDVYGRVSVGGIAGKSSSYTTVTECLNMNKTDAFGNVVNSYIVATRWNKPSPAGIVGVANGEVSYCANFANVASATWADEERRTLNTQNGYYAAGIVGMLTYFDDRAPANGGITTPISEVYSCYNAGDITSGAGMRQRGIVGQNDGYVHDNVLLAGVVDDDKVVYGDSPGDKEASGTVGENRVYSSADLRGEKIAEAVAFMNRNSVAEGNGWTRYWIVSREAERTKLNGGYPLLNRQDPWGDDVELLTAAQLRLVEDAPYTGGASLPTLEVTLDGTVLTANADYRIVVDEGSVEPSTGKPYSAYVVGLGRYAGTSDARVAYDIVAGDMSKCSVSVMAHTFNYKEQLPSADDVTVRTPTGTVVDEDEYTFAIVDAYGNEAHPVNARMYRIVVTAREGSKVFYGSVEGKYRIKPASFSNDVKFDDTALSYLGKTYPWVDSMKTGESDNPATTLPYTGVPVKPVVQNVTYEGHTLVEGVDYKVVYGNANSDDGDTNSQDENNLGRKDGRTIGCVTIRYIAGSDSNFSSYANMFFNIVDDGEKTDLAGASYRVEDNLMSDGKPIEPVEVYLGTQKLAEGVDYTIAYANNVNPGTATFTATGIGAFTGTLEGAFEIGTGELYQIAYAFDGDGTADAPFEATVTGAEYYGVRETFALDIPASVEHGGREYAVVAVGDKAFGGSSATDFMGTIANESKMKLESVSLPATVRTIGDYAFGTLSGNSGTPALTRVSIATGSQLAEIGKYAFANCVSLTSFTMPASMSLIDAGAFRGCTGLSELRFLTREATLPGFTAQAQTVTKGAFYQCSGIVVRGYSTADAVRAIAEQNSGDAYGKHGGKNFTFAEIEELQDASLGAIGDQQYTGGAIRPTLVVTNGATRLVEGVDYEASYSGNVDVGVAHVEVTGIGRWGGTLEASFNIKPAPMSKVEFSAIWDTVFSGEPASYAPQLAYLERSLVEGVDYTLSYADSEGNALADAPSQVGSYRLVATGKGNFEGTRFRAFRIVLADFTNAAIDNVGQKEYTGAAIEPSPNVRLGSEFLERDVDYVLSYDDNVERGQATLTARGINGYEGELSASFNIVAASVEGATVAGVSDVGLADLAGGAVSFAPVVVLNGTLLAPDEDYTVSYAKVAEKKDDSGADGDAAETDGDSETELGSESGTGFGSADSGAGALHVSPQSDDAYEGSQLVPATIPGITAAPLATQDGGDEGAGEGDGDEGADEPGDEIDAPGEAGTYFLVVKGRDNYRGSVAVKFRIVEGAASAKADLSAALVELDSAELAYNGGLQKPHATVTLGSDVLTEGEDFVVSYAGNVGPTSAEAPARATVHGIGAYEGTASATFAIRGVALTGENVAAIADVPYTVGLEARPVLVVKAEGRSLVAGKDYSVAYSNNTGAGQANAHVSGMGGYSGEFDVAFSILPADMTAATVEIADQVYSGAELKPAVTVKLGDSVLSPDADYDVKYENNKEAGTATAVVTAKGNYTGTASGSFAIAPLSIADARVTASPQTYTGAKLRPDVTVRVGTAVLSASDFTASYKDNVNAGVATVTVTGKGNYTGTASGTFAINPKDLSKASITLSATKLTYSGKAQKPTVKTVKVGSATLVKGTDFTVSYQDAKSSAAGTYTVTVKGKGNYASSAQKTYQIVRADLSKAKVTVKAATYTGKAQKPAATVKLGSTTLKSGTDYTVAYSNNKNASKAAKYKVTGKGNYTGTVTGTFTINPAAQTLTLKAKASAPTVKASKLKGAAQTVAASKAFTLTGAKTTVTYAKVASGSSAKLTVNKKTGAITVAKGTKKGTYKVKVKATAAKTTNYKAAASKVVTITVKVTS